MTAIIADSVAPDAGFPPHGVVTPVDGLTLLATFYVAAQAIERLLEPFSSVLVPKQEAKTELATASADAKTEVANAAESAGEGTVAVVSGGAVQIAANKKAALMALEKHRTTLYWAIASAVGVAVSAGMKLYFLNRVGIANNSRWWEVLATGLVIGAGTKPLHDLIEFISAKKAEAEDSAKTP